MISSNTKSQKKTTHTKNPFGRMFQIMLIHETHYLQILMSLTNGSIVKATTAYNLPTHIGNECSNHLPGLLLMGLLILRLLKYFRCPIQKLPLPTSYLVGVDAILPGEFT